MTRIIYTIAFASTLLISCLLPSPVYSCDCADKGNNFFETINYVNRYFEQVDAANNLIVVTGKISQINSVHHQMTLNPEKIIQSAELGPQVTSNPIVILGDDGSSCLASVDSFQVGQEYILGLFQDSPSTFSASSCGVFFMEISSAN